MLFKSLIKSAVTICAVLLATGSFAQNQMPKRSPEERAKMQTTWMQTNLKLSDDQAKQVWDINMRHATKMDQAMNMPRGSEKKNEREEIMVERDSQLKKVLNPDQFMQYQAHEQQMKEKMRERRNSMQQQN